MTTFHFTTRLESEKPISLKSSNSLFFPGSNTGSTSHEMLAFLNVGLRITLWRFGFPLVVAINVTDHFISERNVVRALYGSVSGWEEPEILNDSRGVWGNKTRPTRTSLSAVLVTRKLRPDRMVDVPICLYHNPRPKRPYVGELTRLTQSIPKDNRLIQYSGEAVESILNLPPIFLNDFESMLDSAKRWTGMR